MTILVLIMGILFELLLRTNELWRVQKSRMEVYENALICLDVVTRDLQSLVVSQEPALYYSPGANYPAASASTAHYAAAFVTSSGIGANPSSTSVGSSTIEVGYQRLLDPNHPGNILLVRRISTVNQSAFDCYDHTDTSWASTWGNDSQDSILAEGVASFAVRFFNDSSVEITTDSSILAPAYAMIEATFRDPAITIDTEARKTERSFSKRVLLKRGTE